MPALLGMIIKQKVVFNNDFCEIHHQFITKCIQMVVQESDNDCHGDDGDDMAKNDNDEATDDQGKLREADETDVEK